MATVRKSLLYTFVGANFVTLFQFLTTLIIARLLTPAEVGTYAVAAVFLGVAALVRDFGVSSYLIQCESLDRKVLQSAFALVLTSAFTIGAVIYLAADTIADFYDSSQIASIMRILSLNFFLTPFGSIALTIARREMRFRALTTIATLAALATAVVSVYLAYSGHGPVSLAWGGVCGTLATFIGSLFVRSKGIPWLPSFKGVSTIFRFGVTSASANVLGYINTAATDLIVGRMLTMSDVGIFNRAISLTQFINQLLAQAIRPVLLPWLSSLKREHGKHIYGFSRFTEISTGLLWPAFATVGFLAEPLIVTLFGNAWVQSAVYVPYICAAAIILSAYNGAPPLLVAAARPEVDMYLQIVSLTAKIIAVMLTAPYGLLAIAQAWPILALLVGGIQQFLLHKVLNVTPISHLHAIKKSLVLLGAVCAAQSLLLIWPGAGVHPVLRLLAGGLATLIVAAVAAKSTKHPIWHELVRLGRRH